MRLFKTFTIAAMLAAGSTVGAMAQTYNATGTVRVNAKGEGTTNQGKNLQIASSLGDPGFEAFTIVDFGNTSTAVNTNMTSLSLTLLNYPASYDISGPLDFFLTSNTTALTPTVTEGYTYQSANTASDGIGTQLGTLINLGPAQYNASEAQSTLDTFTFTLNSASKSLLLQDLAAGDVKIAIGTNTATTAQFDGLGYGATPTMSMAASAPVPEASTTASFGLLLALGLGGIIVARRRKQA